jgi:hypothetical protein
MTPIVHKAAPVRPPTLTESTHLPLSILSRLLSSLAAVVLCTFLVSCGSKTESPPAPPASQTNTAAPTLTPAASASTVSAELTRLIGKWERPDGGYVLEVKGVDPSGKADVAYYNPNPINVSRAAAWREKGTAKIVVELRDTGYPGCTYTLEFNPQSDQLFGQYFQAAQQATYEVVFARMK